MQDGRYLARGDSRYPPLCTKRGATSSEDLKNMLQEKKKPEIQVQIVEARQDHWSLVGGYTCRYHVAPRRKLFVPRFSDTFELHRCPETNENVH